MSKLADVFAHNRAERKGTFIPFITLGDPTSEHTLKIASVLSNAGSDVLELGLPYSDPVADGPTIQQSYTRSLARGMTPDLAFPLLSKIHNATKKPLVILTYYNIVLQRGLDKFFADAVTSGVVGVVIPDLPVEEAAEALQASRSRGVDIVFLVAPTTDESRLIKIANAGSGFLYVIALFGVTGARESLTDITKSTVTRISKFTKGKIPIAVGFGISKPSHAREVMASGADGVIVGSALLDIIQRQQDLEASLKELDRFVVEMKAATTL